MDRSSGKDLLKTLETLNIDLGALRPEVIEAWFDTDDEDLLNFLHWMTTSLSEDNVVSHCELQKYEQLERERLVLHDEEYESAMREVNDKYSNLFDVKSNILETEYLEAEIAMYVEEEKQQEELINLNQELNKTLSHKLCVVMGEADHSIINMENAKKNCLRLCQKLDEKNIELHQKIVQCCDKLANFENVENTSYIFNMPMDVYDRYYQDVVEYLSHMFTEQYKQPLQLQSFVKTCSKVNESIFRYDNVGDKILILKQRLFKSIQDKNYKEVTEQRLKAELKYYENINLYDLSMHTKTSKYLRLKFNLEACMHSKAEQISILSLELENIARQASEMYVNLPKLESAKNESIMLQATCDEWLEVHKKFTPIFLYHSLVYLMLMAKNSDIKEADGFFRDIRHYIIHDLHNSENHADAMANVIDNYKIHIGKPIEETNPFVKALIDLMPGKVGTLTLKEAVDLFNISQNDCKKMEMQLFFDEFINHRNVCKEIEIGSKLLKSFLQSGPTSEYITLPFKLFQTFEKVKSILETQKNAIASCMEIRNNAFETVSKNKWLKLRRRLWMYFVTEPKLMLLFIQQIEAEVNKK